MVSELDSALGGYEDDEDEEIVGITKDVAAALCATFNCFILVAYDKDGSLVNISGMASVMQQRALRDAMVRRLTDLNNAIEE